MVNSEDRPSDEIDTMAYAVSFMQAAERISDTDWTDNHSLIVPFFALIGFSLENGFKAVLEHRKVGRPSNRSLDWFHSHDLLLLRGLARDQGLLLLPNINDLIDDLAIPHKEHHFRYPQKARSADLMNPPTVVILTDAMLRMVFDFIDGHSRMD